MKMNKCVASVATLAVSVSCAHGAIQADTPVTSTLEVEESGEKHPMVYPPVNRMIDREILPKLDFFFEKLLDEKEDITLDGVEAFTGKDKFLPGKIAIGLSYLLLNTPEDSPKFDRYLKGYRAIADMTIDDRNETWGIYYYVSALNRLKEAGLLERAVSQDTLEKLKEKTDWRRFVDQENYSLIDLPTNYYGVAFSIARLRYLLGWEDKSGSEKLLSKMMDHYEKYSGEYGFSDETEGEGRFDRYSVLLIGEISQRFIETGMEVTPRMKEWLRNAVDVILVRLNEEGHGFSFGRSIGAYGDTAFLEVLSAAAYLDVLTPREEEMAYAFAARATERYVDFWYDEEMNSVNLWDKGRTTDDYRGKHRILGENLSLSHQLIYTANIWNEIGYEDKIPSKDFASWLEELPKSTITWFARGEYDRALATYRDENHVISLPLINGGESQHMNNPYFPIPFSNGMLEGTPDEDYPQLLPRFTLADGGELIPASFIRDVETSRNGDTFTVMYHQEAVDKLGERHPVEDDRLKVETRYDFSPGKITRTDIYRSDEALEVDDIELEFASFSNDATLDGNTVTFNEGDVVEFSVTGLDECEVESVDGEPPYQTPVGPLLTRVACESSDVTIDDPMKIGWSIKYKS
ncbi:hypothetical protein SAMN02745148_02115 [Modicisalibacter ilicicola DSM 19980]|uniref:Heparinase II/III-like protein n=1 Tax=Modicisalibacter ilicicola DSM 19980 TaxID=1121942 RepID=A0A1M4ZZU6_9GAMM|nr:hypothetical protein [Halomonas ilicicola]SHF23242.1 hypothetical protein SAMN02745148_02115 [Halomonas ilicicola DSM 19980]